MFVGAVGIAAYRRGCDHADVTGVEIAIDTYMGIVAQGLLAPDRAILSDFLAIQPFPVDVAIGNPPYVRLRHLPQAETKRARAAGERVLGSPMGPDGSLWMPFVLHAAEFLVPGGRMAFGASLRRDLRPLCTPILALPCCELRQRQSHQGPPASVPSDPPRRHPASGRGSGRLDRNGRVRGPREPRPARDG